MDVSKAIESRKSVRLFTEDDVSEDKIAVVLDAARKAPSWKNMQCARFIVVRDDYIKQKVVSGTSMGNQRWLDGAPVIIIACADPDCSGYLNDQAYYLVDVAIAMDHLMLSATELGLGTCWVGVFEEDSIKDVLGIPKNIKVVGLTPLGVPLKHPETTRSTTRMPIDEVVCYERYSF